MIRAVAAKEQGQEAVEQSDTERSSEVVERLRQEEAVRVK